MGETGASLTISQNRSRDEREPMRKAVQAEKARKLAVWNANDAIAKAMTTETGRKVWNKPDFLAYAHPSLAHQELCGRDSLAGEQPRLDGKGKVPG